MRQPGRCLVFLRAQGRHYYRWTKLVKDQGFLRKMTCSLSTVACGICVSSLCECATLLWTNAVPKQSLRFSHRLKSPPPPHTHKSTHSQSQYPLRYASSGDYSMSMTSSTTTKTATKKRSTKETMTIDMKTGQNLEEEADGHNNYNFKKKGQMKTTACYNREPLGAPNASGCHCLVCPFFHTGRNRLRQSL